MPYDRVDDKSQRNSSSFDSGFSGCTYADVRCDACGDALIPENDHVVGPDGTWNSLHARDALHLGASGGYGEFLDVFGTGPRALLCRSCAIRLCQENPWLLEILAPHLNGSIGHRCVDERVVWAPVDQCQHDPDRHGWRPVWLVGQVHPTRPGRLSPARAAFDYEDEAMFACRDGETVQEWPISEARRTYPGLFSARSRKPRRSET